MFKKPKTTLKRFFEQIEANRIKAEEPPPKPAPFLPTKPRSTVAELYLCASVLPSKTMTVTPPDSKEDAALYSTASSVTASITNATPMGATPSWAHVFASLMINTSYLNFDFAIEMIRDYLTKDYLLTKYPVATHERTELLNIADLIFDERVIQDTL